MWTNKNLLVEKNCESYCVYSIIQIISQVFNEQPQWWSHKFSSMTPQKLFYLFYLLTLQNTQHQ